MCDDGFDISDATVVCKQLGYPGAIEYYCCGFYGQGSGSIWLDDVACTGTETSVYDCSHSGFGNHNCVHNEDVGVECRGISTFNIIAATNMLMTVVKHYPLMISRFHYSTYAHTHTRTHTCTHTHTRTCTHTHTHTYTHTHTKHMHLLQPLCLCKAKVSDY